MNLQDAFLNQIRIQKVPVMVYLVGGQQQLKGVIKGFDSFIILLESSGRPNLIYKHAVSNIVPLKNVTLFEPGESKEQGK